MQKINKIKYSKTLSKLHKELLSIYTLTKIEQEALDLCLENGKDCTQITTIIDVILDKFKRTLEEFERMMKE